VPLLPTIAAGILGTLAIAWHLGRRERGRIARGTDPIESGESILSFTRDMTLARPRLIWLNLALTLAMLGIAIARLVPLPLAFMIGFAVAMLLNYPSPRLQGERLKAHAENALPIVVLILPPGRSPGSWPAPA
jgi:CitMHS family citrate-Mg2+:H+ or citrate-Ca2+:H+ symporter